jgi:hypothetical protein
VVPEPKLFKTEHESPRNVQIRGVSGKAWHRAWAGLENKLIQEAARIVGRTTPGFITFVIGKPWINPGNFVCWLMPSAAHDPRSSGALVCFIVLCQLAEKIIRE